MLDAMKIHSYHIEVRVIETGELCGSNVGSEESIPKNNLLLVDVWVGLAAHPAVPGFQCVNAEQPCLEHFSDVSQGLMLMRTLQEHKAVIMQRARAFCDSTAPNKASHRPKMPPCGSALLPKQSWQGSGPMIQP